MNNFKQKYKDYYDALKASDNLKDKVLNNTVCKHKVFNLKNALITVLIVVGCITCTTIVFASVKSYIFNIDDDKCVIEAPIVDVNNSVDLTEGDYVTVNALSNLLNLDILSNDLISGYNVEKVVRESDNLAYIQLSSDVIELKGVVADAWDESTVEVSVSLATKYATDEYLSFYKSNCSTNNFDIIYNEQIDTDIYILTSEVTAYVYSDLEFNMQVYFNYEGLMYSIRGTFVNRSMLLDFLNTLN